VRLVEAARAILEERKTEDVGYVDNGFGGV
jgi:hypothetical protein